MNRWVTTALILLALPARLAAEEWVTHRNYLVDADGNILSCLACHDGSRAPAVSSCSSGMCKVYANHVVGVKVPPEGKEVSYPPEDVLAENGMRLENGRITCTTCHDLRVTRRFQLVIYPERSALCQVCHLYK